MTKNNKKIETLGATRTRDFYVFAGGFVKTTTNDCDFNKKY